MAIRYEYNSTCCGHHYMETRRADDQQVVTKCNVCGQGDYQEVNQVHIEDVIEPVYQAPVEDATVLPEE